MDALEFLKECKRLCEVYFEKAECKECPLENMGCWTADFCADDSCEKVIAAVEQWSKEHPRKTRQSVFLEQWPNCMIDNNGVVGICPRNVDNKCICDLGRSDMCPGCRREFWGQEAE